jgi:hypothetical protein
VKPYAYTANPWQHSIWNPTARPQGEKGKDKMATPCISFAVKHSIAVVAGHVAETKAYLRSSFPFSCNIWDENLADDLPLRIVPTVRTV